MTETRGRLPEGPALLEVRHGIRRWLAAHDPVDGVAVALSGGADSLALTAAAVAEIGEVHALVVDHRLQAGSGDVAQRAADRARTLGCASARVLAVDVTGRGGVEAAARSARYAALDGARANRPVLLGHTLDDQAETVLLGLARGSGPRSIAGMRDWDEPWGRPLLGVRRDTTERACGELGLQPWHDPHNADPAFTRVRLRTEALPLLEQILGGGVAQALARTAAQLREDGEVLDASAAELRRAATVHSETGGDELDTDVLGAAHPAIRRRAMREWLQVSGVVGLTDVQLRAADDLVGRWRGQGGVALGGGRHGARLVLTRRRGRLSVGFVTSEPAGR
ncbi:tRNA(Ile)-lysidine synthase [Rhodococcus sp. RD6.2]|uniref:tRNA lysidine(34) synthetase TilS n=1 Tax=Rhodococcus sp. RD6.2 TaxID=260936 RepID=UPI00063B0A46|nr:tRNA lysidine(34) synthetase TilS [Rhodococcus sp. RD6.2]CRK50192.1 tRNA(Ile)-lysidine synthase [Rhodococcus sp. RD6.2]